MAEQPVVISATLVDEWGIEKSAPFYAQADDTQTIAGLIAEAGLFYRALDAASDAFIRRVKIELVPVIGTGGVTGLKGTATTGGRVEQTGLLGFKSAGTTKRYSAAIPAVTNTAMTGDRLTLGSGPVDLLITILTTVGTVLKWCNEHNQQIAAAIDALVSFRKARKQLQRSSLEAA